MKMYIFREDCYSKFFEKQDFSDEMLPDEVLMNIKLDKSSSKTKKKKQKKQDFND